MLSRILPEDVVERPKLGESNVRQETNETQWACSIYACGWAVV